MESVWPLWGLWVPERDSWQGRGKPGVGTERGEAHWELHAGCGGFFLGHGRRLWGWD